MEKVSLYAAEEHISMLRHLRKIPFAKMDDGYRFASWVYDLSDTEEEREKLQESFRGEQVVELLNEAKTKLEEIVVSEDDYLAWTIHKKEAGGVAQYHRIMHDLSISLLMLNIKCTADDVADADHVNEDFFYTIRKEESSGTTKQILNRSNPFADVTIKSQQFFYKTAEGETETLFFNTNNIVEKVDKNDSVMLTMRPGFSVTKEHGVVQRPMQKVTFSNSMTEPVVGDEDHIYIHID